MDINERIIAILIYCRKYGWAKTRDILWFEYHQRLISAKEFKRIMAILETKGLTQ